MGFIIILIISIDAAINFKPQTNKNPHKYQQ